MILACGKLIITNLLLHLPVSQAREWVNFLHSGLRLWIPILVLLFKILGKNLPGVHAESQCHEGPLEVNKFISLPFCRTMPHATQLRTPGILRQCRMNVGYLLTPAHSQKLSPAVNAQHFLSSYCALSKDFSLHTSFTTCYRDFTKPVHTLYTKKRRKRTGLGKKEKNKDVSANCSIINMEINKAQCSSGY